MELRWNKPKCEKCRHRAKVNYDKGKINKVNGWRCAARGHDIENNTYYKRMDNCWYFEKK